MSEPMTPTGQRLYRSLNAPWAADDLTAIEAEAREQEADEWRRLPGTYRREDGGVEVIVGLDESRSYVEDMFPDEVDAIRAEAARQERERLRELANAWLDQEPRWPGDRIFIRRLLEIHE